MARSYLTIIEKKMFMALLVIVAIFFNSCNNNKQSLWKNEQINLNIRKKIHGYNDDMFKSLKANNIRQLEPILSEEVIEDVGTRKLVEDISNQLKLTDYTLYDEYYVINKDNGVNTIKNTARGINNYELNYEGVNPEMYFSFFVPENGNTKQMITAVYFKFDYGWRLGKLDMRPYTINGKTGPQLYQLAIAKNNKGYISDAINIMEMASSCARPGTFMKYLDNIEENNFYNKIIDIANKEYKFPLVVTAIPTHPQIFRIMNKHTADAYYPMIYYLSNIDLKDTLAIKKENSKVKKIIGQIIPGIDKEKKYLFYGVFNKLPNVKNYVDHFDIQQEIESN